MRLLLCKTNSCNSCWCCFSYSKLNKSAPWTVKQIQMAILFPRSNLPSCFQQPVRAEVKIHRSKFSANKAKPKIHASKCDTQKPKAAGGRTARLCPVSNPRVQFMDMLLLQRMVKIRCSGAKWHIGLRVYSSVSRWLHLCAQNSGAVSRAGYFVMRHPP